MLSLAQSLASAAARAWIGRQVSVLFEQPVGTGRLTGLTEHYLRVRCSGPRDWLGRVVELVPRLEAAGELTA